MKKVYRCEQCKTLYKTDKPMKECPFCKSLGKDNIVKALTHKSEHMDSHVLKLEWIIFDNEVNTDENGALETSFFGFPKGTQRADVWKWFNDHYDGGVMKLMTDVQHVDENGIGMPSKNSPSSESLVNKINDQFADECNRPGCLMINGALNNGLCSVSFTGDRAMIDRVVASIMASSVSQIAIKDPRQYFQTLAHNAYVLYCMNCKPNS